MSVGGKMFSSILGVMSLDGRGSLAGWALTTEGESCQQ